MKMSWIEIVLRWSGLVLLIDLASLQACAQPGANELGLITRQNKDLLEVL